MNKIATCGAFLSLFLKGASPACATSFFPNQFDGQICSAAKTWLPLVPWTIFKAQLYQESSLNPNEVSYAGARGIAQFMPGTWADISKEIGFAGTPSSVAGPAILGAAYYMAKLRMSWSNSVDFERHKLALASYNAGLKHIQEAAAAPACRSANSWNAIAMCLPPITKQNSQQTVDYIKKIWIWWQDIELGL